MTGINWHASFGGRALQRNLYPRSASGSSSHSDISMTVYWIYCHRWESAQLCRCSTWQPISSHKQQQRAIYYSLSSFVFFFFVFLRIVLHSNKFFYNFCLCFIYQSPSFLPILLNKWHKAVPVHFLPDIHSIRQYKFS